MDVKRKAMKIFSTEEQPMILRCHRRRFQTSYKSAAGEAVTKKTPRQTRQSRTARLQTAEGSVD
jgi:hypothetical protein